jgi:hypothetical protein
LLAGMARLFIAAGGGWMVVRWSTGGLAALFVAIAVALIAYALIIAGAMRADAWRARTTSK